jgi:hypothetical protein
MRKQDSPVKEVVCSETGKPMTKIPQWMADVKVKFVSDEARQRHPTIPVLQELDVPRRDVSDLGEDLKAIGAVGALIGEEGYEEENVDPNADAEAEEYESE